MSVGAYALIAMKFMHFCGIFGSLTHTFLKIDDFHTFVGFSPGGLLGSSPRGTPLIYDGGGGSES